MTFKLAKDGLLGQMLRRKSEDVENTELVRPRLKPGKIPLQTKIFSMLTIIAYGCWGSHVGLQLHGYYFNRMYPHCILQDYFSHIGDGVCDKWANTIGMLLKIIITMI